MDRSKQLAPLAGVGLVAGIVTALLTPETPDSTASGAKVIAFYQNHHSAAYVAAIALAFAAASGVLYFVSVAGYLRRRGADVLATTTAVGAAVLASGLLTACGLLIAANDAPGTMTADVARTLNVLQNDVFAPAMFIGLGIATLSVGVAALRTKALPKALGIITVIVGVGALSGFGSWFAFMASGPLTLVIAGYVCQRQGRPEQIQLPEPRTATSTTTSATEKATT